MRILADEDVDAAIVAWLRDQGHDVSWAVELGPGNADDAWIDRAMREQRVVLTRDRDFGELVFLHKRSAYGVVLLRLPGRQASQRLAHFQRAWASIGEKSIGQYVVATPGKVRFRPLQATGQ